MEIDLLTVFPGIVRGTQEGGRRKEVEDTNVCDYITFKGARIIFYRNLQWNPGILARRYWDYIDEIDSAIVDSKGNRLTDYTIILDRGIESEALEPPTSDAQQLVSYFSYLQHLDRWISLGFIKVLCFPPKGRMMYLNNQIEFWPEERSLTLPVREMGVGPLRIGKHEKSLMDILSAISDKRLDTYKRLINAMALFNESCRINAFSPNSSIVLITSAFEGLLDLPRYSKKENFGYALKILWGFDRRIEKWATELYALRSQIVHGDVAAGERLLASKDRHYPHFKIAREMFHSCLLFILESHGTLIVDKRLKFEVIRQLRNYVVSNKEKIDKLVSQRKRFSYQAFVNKKGLYKEFLVRVEELTSTDYSGRDIIPGLLELILRIARDWIEAEMKQSRTLVSGKGDEYLEFTKERFGNILKLFDDIERAKWSLKGRLEKKEKMRVLKKEVNQLERVFHRKEEFKFTVSEFLDRCLRATIATF